MEVCQCESVPSEQQSRVLVEPVVSDGRDSAAGGQTPIKPFRLPCQIALEKWVREVRLSPAAQECASCPE